MRDADPQALDNPFLERLGVRLSAWSPGHAEMVLETAQSLGNRTGRVQGGVLCTLLDAVAGYAGLYTAPGVPAAHSLTLTLTTQFIASGPGRLLVARGVLERQGRSIYFARGEVRMDGELLLATAVGTFKYLRAPAADASTAAEPS